MGRYIPTGCIQLDSVLEGGLRPGELTLLYGEAETGKTSLAMQCSVNSARMGYKVLFVDADKTFFPQRLMQIALHDFNEVSQLIILFSPSNFEEQSALIDELEKYISEKLGLIVFDTITSLYRAEIGSREEAFKANRELNRQIAMLTHIAKKFHIPILITSQVRNILTEVDALVEPVAARVLRFWSANIIGLSKMSKRGVVKVTIERSGGIERRTTLYLFINENGVHEYNKLSVK